MKQSSKCQAGWETPPAKPQRVGHAHPGFARRVRNRPRVLVGPPTRGCLKSVGPRKDLIDSQVRKLRRIAIAAMPNQKPFKAGSSDEATIALT